jgi:hypothetical protein
MVTLGRSRTIGTLSFFILCVIAAPALTRECHYDPQLRAHDLLAPEVRHPIQAISTDSLLSERRRFDAQALARSLILGGAEARPRAQGMACAAQAFALKRKTTYDPQRVAQALLNSAERAPRDNTPASACSSDRPMVASH